MKVLTLRNIPEEVKKIIENFKDRPYDNRGIKGKDGSNEHGYYWRYPTSSATKSFYSIVQMYGDLIKSSKDNPEGVIEYLQAQRSDSTEEL